MGDPWFHETAVIEPGARIGEDTRIWHHAHVRSGAAIGERCNIGKNVYIDTDVTVGSDVKIQNNVSLYQGVVLDDEVFIGPSAVFTNDRFPRATNTEWEVIPTTVQRGASIGANATIVCGHDIASFATVAAGAVVTRDLAAHELVAGNPARRLGWVCRCGRISSRDDTAPDDLRCERCQDEERRT